KIEILFTRNTANVQQANLTVASAELLEKSRVASSRMKQLGVEATRQNFQFCRIETAFDPALTVHFRINENGVELAVEPMHVTPRHAFEKTVLCQDADVLREIGMINAASLQVEHLGREQCR